MRRITVVWWVGLLLLVACGGQPSDALRVAAAPGVTVQAGTARMAREATSVSDDGGATLTGEGFVDFAQDRSVLILPEAPERADGTPQPAEIRWIGDEVFVRAGGTGADGVWTRIELRQGGGLHQFAGDPILALLLLRGVTDDLEVVDETVVRDVPVTHYRAGVDARLAADQSTSEGRAALAMLATALPEPPVLPVEVWIDEAGRVRRLSYSVELPGRTFDTTVEFFDFGDEATVETPATGPGA